jgi:HTH-type transcriptional regulator/antitoxin HigA
MEDMIRPIHSDAEYEVALAEAARFMDAAPGTAESDRLEVLVMLIEAYEARHWAVGSPDPIDAIRIRMEEKGLKARDLEPMIGSRGRVSEVLSRKRALTLPMIRRLSRGLDLPADVLIQEVPLAQRKPGGTERKIA